MGGFLRFKEKVRQTVKKGNQPDQSGFVPTTYDRTSLTYEEAVKFAESMKIIRKRIGEASHARMKMLRDVETTLTGPLPCIHEIDPVSGEHTTSEAAPEEKGVETNYVRAGTLTRLSEEQDAKMQEHVFAPVDRWISEVDLFKGKMKIIENLRLDLDGSRRDHVKIESKIATAEQKNADVDPKHTTHIQSKDASIAGKTLAFQQYEAQIYEELVNLISESSVLHDALINALKLEIDTYQRALDPIASTTARLEDLSTTSGSPMGSVTPPPSALGGPVSSVGGPAAGQAPQTGAAFPSSGATGTAFPSGGAPGFETASAKGSEMPNVPTHTVPTHTHPSSVLSGGAAAAPAAPSNVAYERPYAS